ncbi:MAG TPA: cytochrome D1 domain-containing protein, partial [Candidatus Kapabacteria bacterium]|nr:cytochrome D1 domain-containing protein [Candidatus Kapabacteria bacterium]
MISSAALRVLQLLLVLLLASCAATPPPAPAYVPEATGDLGVVIERGTGSVLIINTSDRTVIGRVEGLGDLSHASVVYSRNERFAYVFGRDGGLTKVDLLLRKIDRRVLQGGNSIGGAISQ